MPRVLPISDRRESSSSSPDSPKPILRSKSPPYGANTKPRVLPISDRRESSSSSSSPDSPDNLLKKMAVMSKTDLLENDSLQEVFVQLQKSILKERAEVNKQARAIEKRNREMRDYDSMVDGIRQRGLVLSNRQYR
jgi:hypothetical protein